VTSFRVVRQASNGETRLFIPVDRIFYRQAPARPRGFSGQSWRSRRNNRARSAILTRLTLKSFVARLTARPEDSFEGARCRASRVARV